MADARRDDVGAMRVGLVGVGCRARSRSRRRRRSRAPRGDRLHHPAEPAADDDRAGLGEARADLVRGGELLVGSSRDPITAICVRRLISPGSARRRSVSMHRAHQLQRARPCAAAR